MKRLSDKIKEEFEGGGGNGGTLYATPGNTLGMGNPYADTEGASEPITPIQKPIANNRKRKKRKFPKQ